MMSKLSFAGILVFALLLATPSKSSAQITKYKCMIQMSNYVGDAAYVAVSLIDSKGAFEKTLYIMGADKQWYKTLTDWYAAYNKKKTNISAITGASVTGGDRSVNVIEIENSKINKGYTIRFETRVEDKKHNVKDVEVPLTTENLAAKTDGSSTGYIRYVRFSPN
jgi:hypothetical protein